MDRLRIALAGVGGFGATHVKAAESLANEGLVEIVSFAEPNESAPAVSVLRENGIRAYQDYFEMLDNEPDLDIISMATPIPMHLPMAIAAFQRKLNLFLEKPPVVRLQDLRNIMEMEDKNDCFCAVGFHDVARPNIIALKNRICHDTLGRIRTIHAHACWRRSEAYYRRNAWAGKLFLNDMPVLDGPMNNALAHMLNLTAYLASQEHHEFARPIWVQGELYRANPSIESEDTCCLRADMDTGVRVCIHLTLASAAQNPRVIQITGDNGTAEYHDTHGVHLPDEHLPNTSGESPTATLLRRLVEVSLGTDEPLLMPLSEAEAFVMLSNGAYESAERIKPIPEQFIEMVDAEGSPAWTIRDIDTIMPEAALAGRLLSECDIPWAQPSRPFLLDKYDSFPLRWEP